MHHFIRHRAANGLRLAKPQIQALREFRLYVRTRASTRAAAQSGTPSRLARGRHRVLRALALSAATLLVLELLYIVAIPTFVNRKLAAVAAESGLDLQVDSLRSWYPGDLRATSIRLGEAAQGAVLTTGRAAARFNVMSLAGAALQVKWVRIQAATLSLPNSDERVSHVPREAGPASGSMNWQGDATLSLVNVRLVQGQMTFSGSASCTDLTLRRAGDTQVVARSAVELDFHWGPHVRKGGRKRWGNLDMTGSARGTASNIAGLLDWQPAKLSAENSRFTANWHLQRGTLLAGSRVDIRASAADGHFGGMVWSAPRGLVLFAEVLNATRETTQFQVSARAVDAKLAHQAGTEPASFGLELAATLEQQRESGALGIVSGALTARQVKFAGHTPPSERPDFTVALEATTWRIADQWRISGKLDGHGKNAGFLMDLFAAGPGVRLMLDELRGQAFQISSHVALDDSMLSFEHIALTTSSMAARGSIFLPRTPLFGAVLVERGAFRLGLVFDEASMTTRLAPPRDWLEQTLASFVVPTAN